MEGEIAHTAQLYKLLDWFEANRKQVLGIGSVALVVGIGVAYFIWQTGQKEANASEALSSLLTATSEATADDLVQFVSAHSGTEAGKRAMLLIAGRLFTEEKYAEAQREFERFSQSNPSHSLAGEARLGVAACLEAQGRTQEAAIQYKAVADNPASGNVVSQARFALALLYEEQGRVDLARTQYELLAQTSEGPLGAEGRARLAEMNAKQVLPAPSTVPGITNPASIFTNQP